MPSARNDYTFNSGPYTKWTIQMQTKNIAGVSSWTDEIQVTTPEAAPSKVTDLRAKPIGSTKIEVTWGEPRQPNGIITGYLVTYRLKSRGTCQVQPGQPIVQNVVSPRFLIENLQPDSTYEIVVAAKTSELGEASDPVLVTTEESSKKICSSFSLFFRFFSIF